MPLMGVPPHESTGKDGISGLILVVVVVVVGKDTRI